MNPLEESVKEVEKTMETFNQLIEESEDVKEGRTTSEEEKQEPGNMLFIKISEMVISILKDPNFTKSFKKISESGLGDDATRELVNILAITSANSAYQALIFYDELLKKELTKQFDHIAHHINIDKSDISGIKSACEVFGKKIGNIENTIKASELKKSVN
jgi:hypothetical protein